MLNAIALYWLAGLAYIFIELIQGGASYLVRKIQEETRAIPSSYIPLLSLLITLIAIFTFSLGALMWPVFVWCDWKNGELFKPGRYDGDE